MALPKTNGGNGFEFVPYKDIVAQYPDAATSYDPNFVSQKGGYIGEDGGCRSVGREAAKAQGKQGGRKGPRSACGEEGPQ